MLTGLSLQVATCLKSDVRLGESPQSKGDDLHSNRQQAFCSQVWWEPRKLDLG